MRNIHTYRIPLILAIVVILLGSGCSNNSTEPKSEVTAEFSMAIKGAALNNLSRFQLTVFDETGELPIIGPVPLAFDDGVVSGSVRVPADQILTFLLEGFDDQDVLLYSGSRQTRVSEGENVTLSISLSPVAPTLRLMPTYLEVERGQRFVMSVKINELPQLSVIEFGINYDNAILSLDSTWLNENVSDDISFFVVDSGNGGVSWYFDDYKPLTDPPGPNRSDSITLGWMIFEVNPELPGPTTTNVQISGINYAANDGNQTDISETINVQGTEVDVSVLPTGRLPEIFIIDPQEADTVGNVVPFRVQVLDDGPIDQNDITLLFEGVRQPFDFSEIPETVNLYRSTFQGEFSQPGTELNFQIEVTDADGNIALSEVRTVTYAPEPQ